MSWVLVQKHLVRKCLHAPFFFTVGLWYFTISFTCRLSHSLWFPPDVQSYSFLAARDWDISDPELQLFCWQIWIYSRALVFVTLVGVDPLTQICNEPLACHPFFYFYWPFPVELWHHCELLDKRSHMSHSCTRSISKCLGPWLVFLRFLAQQQKQHVCLCALQEFKCHHGEPNIRAYSCLFTWLQDWHSSIKRFLHYCFTAAQ